MRAAVTGANVGPVNLTPDIPGLAAYLDAAQQGRYEIDQLGELSMEAAYEVQRELVGLRLARGERVVGSKLGLTSKAKWEQMGVNEVIAGVLTDEMAIADEFDLSRFIHPKAEPEVAFRLAADLDPADANADIVAAIDAVAPALEIIDSRYRDFKFTVTDVIADNTSAAGYVIGPWSPLPADHTELDDLAVELVLDGDVVQKGSTADILGSPTDALRALVPLAARHRIALRAGDVVLAGAATAAVLLGEQQVEARVAGLGRVSTRGRRG
ncbi:MAG: fumarylacetoacetate hydrolase family protein [Nocardioidaceae bacterium]